MNSDQAVTPAYVIRFWIPLSLTWLLMSVEAPVLASLIARMEAPAYNLAAYGVAIAIAMFIESPVIMLLSTTVALATNRQAYVILYRFMTKVCIVVTIGMIIVCIPWVYDMITTYVVPVPLQISQPMYYSLIALIPWPAAIGVRRFYQGVLIRNGLTRMVAFGTVVRVFGMAGTGILLFMVTQLAGAVVGAISLSVGVLAEMLTTIYMSRSTVSKILNSTDYIGEELNSRDIRQFYIPLAMTSVMGFTVTPMLAFFMSRGVMPLESLAVLPVIDSFVFFFRSFGFSYQEVCIALLGKGNRNYQVIKRVGIGIMLVTTATLALCVLTPLSKAIFQGFYGLSDSLASFSVLPALILLPLPVLSVLYSIQRAVLINVRKNIAVTWSTITEILGILVFMTLISYYFSLPGAVGAAIAMVVGRTFANFYLRRQSAIVLRTTFRGIYSNLH